MANFRIKAASLIVQGIKVGQFDTNEYTLKTGDEAQFGDPGYAGHSDGAPMTTVKAGGYEPIQGKDFDFHAAMLAKQDLEIMLTPIAGGQLQSMTMRCTEATVSSKHRSGTQEGSYSFEGGPPSVTTL